MNGLTPFVQNSGYFNEVWNSCELH